MTTPEITPDLLAGRPLERERTEAEWTPPGGSFLGRSVPRREDPRFLTGNAQYTADLTPPGTVHVAFVRSTMASAALTMVDTAEAVQMPGVVTVLTGLDCTYGPVPQPFVSPEHMARPVIARDQVRFVGEIVAVVVAETYAAAVDAAECVVVDYDPLPVVVDVEAALEPDSFRLFSAHDSNVYFDTALLGGARDPSVTDGADVVVDGVFRNQRLCGAALETNAALAEPNGGGVRLTIPHQIPFDVRSPVAAALGLADEDVRVVVPDVGGGFGTKSFCSAEFIVIAGLARDVQRPVKWVAARGEDLQTMPQGRGQVQHVRLALDNDGTFEAIDVDIVQDGGAYPTVGALLPMVTRLMTGGPYRFPRASFGGRTVATNTSPVGGYRGAGRPEATYLLERIIDIAAHRLDIDPVQLRLRNLISKDSFPYTNPVGMSYDSGDYQRALEEVCRLGEYEEVRAEQRQRRAQQDPILVGVGVSCYVEITAPGIFNEFARVEVDTEGTVTAAVGTSAHGQGHETVFTMIVADILGVDSESIRFVQSDTGAVPRGLGTRGSRSLQLAGSGLYTASVNILERAKQVAAQRLEAAAEDIVVIPGAGLGVRGVPSSAVSWAQLASLAPDSETSENPGFVETVDFDQGDATFPFGAHLAVVDIDSETGGIRLRRLVAVDDCGAIVHPQIVTGQVHGGAAQGIAQALFEGVCHDEDGNPLTASFLDYLVPSAADLPNIESAHTVTPTTRNPLGAKGIGESATIGATPAVHNAVMDALRPFGIEHLDMPVTPEKVWTAIRDAYSARSGVN